ncbi:MAG: hypothetical protein JST87_18645 [Bacteroidetes bacterium]|nr:hypothetical protein [Bacteroidota bacterium]
MPILKNGFKKVMMTIRYGKNILCLAIFFMIAFLANMNSLLAQTTPMWNPSYSIGPSSGVYSYNYTQTPSQLVEVNQAAFPNTGLTYSWESCPSPSFQSPYTVTVVATTASYSPPALTSTSQTLYYRRKAISSTALPIYGTTSTFLYSNIVKISVVSVNWEDINYIREHDVLTTAQTSWTAIDQLAIGSKLQTTTYLDGLGRSVEKVSAGTATPPQGSNTWGDMVQFSQYDVMGREPKKYLPYTSTNQSGKYKTAPLTDQPAYYSNANTYNETSAFSSITFDNSPLNRVMNVKEPGASWNASAGNSANYDMNTAAENVQVFRASYVQGNAPVNYGAYAADLLYKLSYTDVNSKQVIEYTNKSGQLILKKVQIDPSPSVAHSGWICTYNVYDDFGLLRFQIQPEGVKYLDANSWSFAGTNGATILAEQVFQYNYDDKGRTIWKKAPGASPLNMLYDIRDRVVFMQDGNQAALSTPQWTANLYDDLDRPVITTLYNTTESISSLQTDIANAVTTTTVSTTNASTPIINLVVDSRDASVTTYSAQTSITFTAGFSSTTSDNFTAQISATAATSPSTNTVTTLNNPVSSTNLNNASVCTILKYLFYDDYSFPLSKTFDNSYTNTSAYSTSDPNVIPIAKSQRTLSMPTGSMTRVLGTSMFLSATNFYDEKGRHIQTIEDNIKSGTDITTNQYHFDGRLLSSCNIHSNPGTQYTGFITLNKYIFDKLGRVTSIQKQLYTNPLKTVATYDYDDMGRVMTKHLDPNYNNPNSGLPDLESLNYSFNIHNQITGINRDYALKTAASYNKWGHFFGMDIGYDKLDNTFATAQLNGQVGGIVWNTQGDDAQRKYDYTYDNAGRLINAAFKQQQHPGDGWANNTMDFSVSGYTGQITYDYNGNLQAMQHKGVVPGTSAPIVIDDLRYSYNSYSNKLQSVTDNMTTTTMNGQFGDFKDGTNAAGTADYVYDANGNVVVDLNKNAQSLNGGAAGTPGVHYNFLDKPDQVRIVGKGTIEIVYSADGEKLQRVFIPETAGSSTITTYINQYVYTETSTTLTTSSVAPFSGTGAALSYINFEEGRIRVMTPYSTGNGYDAITEGGNMVLPAPPSGGGGVSGVWDYFVMDYQQNVRMILTEETHSATNTCTMETNRASAEDPVFQSSNNEVESTRIATPAGWTSNTSASVSHLGKLSGHFIGPNVLQKVMAGDKVSATVQYYLQASYNNTNPNIISNILSSLLQAVGGNATTGTLVHSNASAITTQLNGVPAFTSAVEPDNGTGSTPQAYLTILFFDERFNLIPSADGGVQQLPVSSSPSPLALLNIKAPKNGYAYVYVSNRSDQDVYFDNLAVNITTGNIIEENHYYAFGLKIAGISSKKLPDANEGNIKNNYLYNDKELFDDADLNWYDYGFRNFDPQIGRFMQMDPLTDEYPFLSSYQYAADDPIANVDIDGLDVGGSIGGIVADGGHDFTYGYKAANDMMQFIKPAAHFAEATSIVSKTESVIKLVMDVTSIIIHGAVIASDLINAPLASTPPGISITLKPGSGYSTIDGKMWKINQEGNSVEAFMPQTMHISEEGLEFLMVAEGLGKAKENIYDKNGNCLITCPYNDPSKFATVGYGHLIEKAPLDYNKPSHATWSNGITPSQAKDLLRDDDAVNRGEKGVKKAIQVPLTQSEFDALVIANYNGGFGNDLKKMVNSLSYKAATIYKTFLEYRYSGKPKKESDGLIARSAQESYIFLYNNFKAFLECQRKEWIIGWKNFIKK